MPKIESIEWGHIKIKHDDKTYSFKDLVIEPSSFYEWNFKDGFDPTVDIIPTSHQFKTNLSKGIQPHSVRHLLNKAKVFILSMGMYDD